MHGEREKPTSTSHHGLLWGIVVFSVLLLPAGVSAQPVQTQRVSGSVVDVDIVRATVSQGVLTVVLNYRNSGKADANVRPYYIEEVSFVSPTEKKKYLVIQDTKGYWLASPVARNLLSIETGLGVAPVKIVPGGSATVWFKFPAPPSQVSTIDLLIPDVAPFEKLPLSR